MPDFAPVRAACEFAGGVTALARRLGLPPQVIHSWAIGQRPIPIIRCVEIEELTGGEVTRKQLRPDDWWQIWPELRGEG
ncbi:MAG: YdaS family helix-turn-helix protein [Castellaniella sp.]|jgi:DNA-binding transcriptional regulator YdaS (Cro superfamily)|uniref:transcriptional regulator n=1 Tax=Castellaniella sp. TaxID=1955812 RepID=UPI00263485E3|nr:YdaS family helix-turn-helix protein [uncultured Castellaniella sp.]